MKYLLLTTIAAVVLVGCGELQPPEPPDISIHKAAHKGNIEAVKQHLDAGTDVNTKNTEVATALHYAAMEGHKEVAELLIDKGADVNARNNIGASPLDLATLFNQSAFADLLRNHGAKTGDELKAEGK